MLSMISAPRTIMIDCAKIHPNPSQPRRYFDHSEIESLAHSIQQHGLLQPISVRKVGGSYELIAGERRLRAAKLAGMTKIACVLTTVDDQASEALALIENIQRCDLNFFEEACAIASLIKNTGLTQAQLAQNLGKSQSSIANKLRLLLLDKPLQERILSEGLTERHARALLTLPAEQRQAALEKIISAQMNVSQTEKYISSLAKKAVSPKPVRKVRGIVRDLKLFDNSITAATSSLRSCGITSVVNRKTVADGVEYTIHLCIPG